MLHLSKDPQNSPPECQSSFYIKRFQVCSVQKNSSYTEVTAAGTQCTHTRPSPCQKKTGSTKEASHFFASRLPERQTTLSIPCSCFPVCCPAENSKKGRGFFCASTNMLEEDDHIYPAVFVVVYLQHEVFHSESLCCHSPTCRPKAQHLAPRRAVRGRKGCTPLC